MKKLLLCLAGALALTNAPVLASQTHYYYNQTGYPVPIKVKVTHTTPCPSMSTTIPAPSDQIPEPWAMRRRLAGCAIDKIEATVIKDGQEIPATPLEYSRATEFTVKEIPAGSNKFAVLEYKEQ